MFTFRSFPCSLISGDTDTSVTLLHLYFLNVIKLKDTLEDFSICDAQLLQKVDNSVIKVKERTENNHWN